MAFIKNLETGIVTEIENKDVIEQLKQDEGFEVTDKEPKKPGRKAASK